MAVLSGGSTSDPIVIFNQRENSWVNETQFFGDSQVPLQASSTISSSTQASSTIASTPTSAAASPSAAAGGNHNGDGNNSRMLTVLGATLGAIFGLAAILIIILLFLRYRKERRRRENGYINEKENRLSFADRGAEFMHEAGGSVGNSYRNSMNNSSSSLAIMTGRAGNGKQRHLRNKASTASTAGLIKKHPLANSETVEMKDLEDSPPRNVPLRPSLAAPQAAYLNPNQPMNAGATRSRSSGWSRYFTNNEATNLASMGHRDTYGSADSDVSRSLYTDSRYHPSEHPSQNLGPLEINLGPKFEGLEPQRISRVATGSPVFGDSHENIGVASGMKAELARKSDASSLESDHDAEILYGGYAISRDPRVAGDGMLTGTTAWTPVSNPNWYERPDSSVYSDGGHAHFGSQRDPHISATPTTMSTVVGTANGTYTPEAQYHHRPRVPSSHYTSIGAGPVFGQDMSLYPSPPRVGHQPKDSNGSTVTVFPRSVQTQGFESKPNVVNVKPPGQIAVRPPRPTGRGNEVLSDMSWINLGGSASGRPI